MTTCPQCASNDGWLEQIGADGVKRFVPCGHGIENRKSKIENRGFESVGAILESSNLLNAALMPHDKKLAAILRNHRGRANAIRSAELAALVFDAGPDPARKEEFRRGVTQSIERLRTFARLPVAATKEPPYGYFLPETQAEWDEMHERYIRELVRVAGLARLFRPQADIVQRLRGQLQLQVTGNRGQGTAGNGTATFDLSPETFPSPEARPVLRSPDPIGTEGG